MSDTETFTIPLLGEDTELSIPDSEGLAILSGGTRWGFLKGFFPESMLLRGGLADLEEVLAHYERPESGAYTWNLLLREVNHLSRPAAEGKLKRLLERDVLHETGPGGMYGAGALDGLQAQTGAETIEEFLVTWLRIANRYAWYERFRQEVPDPIYDPIPPIEFGEVGDRYKRHVYPYIRDTFHSKGESRALDVISAAILYVFGFIAERPSYVREDTWQRAVTGLFGSHKPLYHMCAHPGDYLNYLAMDEQSGVAGFFPTPIAVTKMMGAMISGPVKTERSRAAFEDNWPGDTPEERKARLLETVSDPCVGTGNMLAHIMNTHVLAELIDINQSMVLATRAMCAMYAPWFVHSVFRANALADYGESLLSLKQEQARSYVEAEARALAGFIHHGVLSAAQPGESGAEINDQVAMLRARAEVRRYAKQMERWQPLIDMLNTTPAEGKSEYSQPPATEQTELPVTNAVRPPASGTPSQLTFFGG
ncbi:MAG: hypothetical protein DWQ07_17580 [Chloroflexi bacterium]|nr:MAG: hypothetical protein DWQ07_17580 [Chloroflexota bacterium]